MWLDQVWNPEPLAYESDALLIALCGPAWKHMLWTLIRTVLCDSSNEGSQYVFVKKYRIITFFFLLSPFIWHTTWQKMGTFFKSGKDKTAKEGRGMGSTFHMLYPRYSGTLNSYGPYKSHQVMRNLYFLMVVHFFKWSNDAELPYKFYVMGQIVLSKQCRPRSDCWRRSSLIRVYAVCHSISIFWMH